jgi:hypothetical protein
MLPFSSRDRRFSMAEPARFVTIAAGWCALAIMQRRITIDTRNGWGPMDELAHAQPVQDVAIDGAAAADAAATAALLLQRVAAAMREIEQATQERNSEEVRAARAQLAALHGVARLRKRLEPTSKPDAA